METKYYVYKHTNKVNGKVYIGITGRKNPKYRWNNGKGYIENKHFWRSIKKYGWNKGFAHEILYSGLSEKQAEVMEVSLIAYYDSTDENKGYNKSPGGGIQSEEARQKISKANKGRKFTEEHKQKISESSKGKIFSEEHKQKLSKSNKGQIRSEETRQKMKDNHADINGKNNPMYGKTGYNNHSSKAVMCITTGQCFGSSSEAARYYNISNGNGSNIRRCCHGKYKSSGKLPDGTKLVWKYVSDLPKPQLTEADKEHLRDLLNHRGISSAQA